MLYKLVAGPIPGIVSTVFRSDGWSIPFDPDNYDYKDFKAQINDGEAQLEGVDGNLMTPEEAKAYVATLP